MQMRKRNIRTKSIGRNCARLDSRMREKCLSEEEKAKGYGSRNQKDALGRIYNLLFAEGSKDGIWPCYLKPKAYPPE